MTSKKIHIKEGGNELIPSLLYLRTELRETENHLLLAEFDCRLISHQLRSCWESAYTPVPTFEAFQTGYLQLDQSKLRFYGGKES
jgi:hypothetical protein